MASSGSFLSEGFKSTTYGDTVYLKFSWSIESQSVDDNTTKISWKLTGQRETSHYVESGGFKVVIDGDTVYNKSTDYRIELRNGTVVASGTKVIKHKDDGTRTFEVSIRGAIYYGNIFCEGTKSFTLDTIARASSLTSAAAVTLGKACSVKWTPQSSAFYYKLVFSIGDFSVTKSGIAPKTTAAYTYTGYTIPIDGPAQEITSAAVGTMKVVLTTHTASSCTSDNQIGSASSKTFNVTVPQNTSTKPTIGMTLSPVSSLAAAFSALYIKGRTKVKAAFTGAGKFGATISSYSVSVDGTSYKSPYTSGYLANAGSITVTGTVTDSRGFTNTATQTITVIDYNAPTLLPVSGQNAVICARCDEGGNLTTSGAYLRISAKRSYSKVVSGGVQKNFCLIRYRVAQEGTAFSGDAGWVTALAKTATSDEVTVILGGVVPSAETAYIVQLGLIDDIGASAAIQYAIPTDFVTIDVPAEHKGKRMGLLRYAKDSDEPGIDVGAPIYGGAIDSLKRGERITATAAAPIDLNNYKTPGCYYSPNAENTSHISNSPYTGGGFILVVREFHAANSARQELFYGATTWLRAFDGSAWGAWVKIQTTTST